MAAILLGMGRLGICEEVAGPRKSFVQLPIVGEAAGSRFTNSCSIRSELKICNPIAVEDLTINHKNIYIQQAPTERVCASVTVMALSMTSTSLRMGCSSRAALLSKRPIAARKFAFAVRAEKGLGEKIEEATKVSLSPVLASDKGESCTQDSACKTRRKVPAFGEGPLLLQ